jgi:hypothetical protein
MLMFRFTPDGRRGRLKMGALDETRCAGRSSRLVHNLGHGGQLPAGQAQLLPGIEMQLCMMNRLEHG